MTDAVAQAAGTEAGKTNGKLGLIVGLVLALAGGGGGYFAVRAGLLPFGGAEKGVENGHDSAASPAESSHDPGGGSHAAADSPDQNPALNGFEFVELEPVTISLRDSTVASLLRFRMQLEVAAGHQQEVRHLAPRIIDLLNGYLRALEPSDFEDPMILPRLRSQILRRAQMVAGPGRVHDVLIMEFVLN